MKQKEMENEVLGYARCELKYLIDTFDKTPIKDIKQKIQDVYTVLKSFNVLEKIKENNGKY